MPPNPASLRPILEVAAELGLGPDGIIPYGHDKAKIRLEAIGAPRGRLVLVSAITPTPAGEGKTTTSIGLAQGLRRLGQSVCVALREPSLGPVFGMKGGGTGGGLSRVQPSAQINLHFTGDLHAISAAHNLLATLIDNHLFRGAEQVLNPRRILWPRALDVNDRALRNVVVGLGGQGVPRESSFVITAASELMAILCLATGPADLRARIGRILVGFTPAREAVTVDDLGFTGALCALLSDALMPNLVQTTEGVPAIVHGGPFANIAHGCSSILGTRAALHMADWAITEAGFGFDLGAEKFFDIKARMAGLDTAAVVLVCTVRALKYHGGVGLKDLEQPDPEAVSRGLPNLEKHLESIRTLGEVAIVALNRFSADDASEIEVIAQRCAALGIPFAVSDHFGSGGDGAVELAKAVMEHAEKTSIPYKPTYELDLPVVDKIRAVTRKIYGGRDVVLTREAIRDLGVVKQLGLTGLPICIAKTQSSLSDDPKLRGRPTDFDVTVRRVRISAGAGFLVVLTGDILTMPGLPRRPAAHDIDVVDGQIVGVE